MKAFVSDIADDRGAYLGKEEDYQPPACGCAPLRLSIITVIIRPAQFSSANNAHTHLPIHFSSNAIIALKHLVMKLSGIKMGGFADICPSAGSNLLRFFRLKGNMK